MRIVKDPEERKNEIMEIAEKLFYENGYENCTVKQIVNEANIAKGTFFYYFPTKESILDEIISQKKELIKQACLQIAQDRTRSREERFLKTILQVNKVVSVSPETAPKTLHQSGNSLMHEKSMVALIETLSPILKEIVIEDLNRLFSEDAASEIAASAEENILIILCSAIILPDNKYFSWDNSKKQSILAHIIKIAELTLGFEKGKIKELLFYLSS